MYMQRLGRFGLVLCFGALVAGCSVVDLGGILGSNSSTPSARDGECSRNRSSCMYEGSYEPGERDYAEEEARRLNRASLEKLKRNRIR